MDTIVLFTGGFDPIHSGHIEAIKECQEMGRVVIGLNSDDWLTRKKGRPFMSFEERKAVLDQFKNILCVIEYDDSDNSSSYAIEKVLEMFPKSKVVFANGGDRTKTNIPELDKFKDNDRVEFVFGVGGTNKKNSSSWILAEWKHPTVERPWGKFMTYYDNCRSKVKRLEINPGSSISMQQHEKRNELWFVEKGVGSVYTIEEEKEILSATVEPHDIFVVASKEWHRLENMGDEPLHIIEIQYGEECVESDITRL